MSEWDNIDKTMRSKGPSLAAIFTDSDDDDIVVDLFETFPQRCSSICKLDPMMLQELVGRAKHFLTKDCDVVYFYVAGSRVEVKPFLFEVD